MASARVASVGPRRVCCRMPEVSTGYLTFDYASAVSVAAPPIQLPASGAWLIERSISGTPFVDASGPYPLLCCRDWRGLVADLAALNGYVSVVAVTDPF